MPRIERVDQKTAREWFSKYHYTGTAGNAQIGRFGFFSDAGDLLAIAIFGNVSNVHGLVQKLELWDYRGNIELTRLAVHPDAPANTATQAVAAALTVLGDEGYEWILSYSDIGQGHHGGIYQGLNASYVGRSSPAILFTANGKRLHNRIIAERYRTTRWPHAEGELCPGKTCTTQGKCAGRMAAKDGIDLQKDWKGSSEKHTYILVCAKLKKDRHALREHLKKFELPYPKKGDGSRAGASGENSPASSGDSLGQSQGPAQQADVEDRRVARSHLRLYPYQRVGAAFMATARAALNGDDMRVGKTPQAIRAMQLLYSVGESVFPALVVCTASIKSVWEEHFADWWPGVRVQVPRAGTAAAEAAIREVQAGNAGVLVLNYETLPNVSRLAGYGSIRLEGCVNCDPLSRRPPSRCQRERKALNEVIFRTVIADEVHRAANAKAQMTRALWAVGDEAEFRYGLTGSPPEEPDLFWAVMRFVAPKEYARKTSFIDRYADTAPNIWSGFAETTGWKAETRAELDKFLLPRFIRRPLDAVSKGLPPARMHRYVELTGKQAQAYESMRKSLIAKLDDGTIYAANPLMELLRLRQFASAYGELDGVGGMTLSEPSSKLDVLEEALDELGHRQAVIFAESRQLIDLACTRIARAGITHGTIHGGIGIENRKKALVDFRTGDVRLLLCTIGAGGEGLDMSSADTAIFLQRSYAQRLNRQAEKRIQGPKQAADAVTILDLITRGTVEQQQHEVLADKDAKLEDLVRDQDTLRRWLS